jgi:hypothetical protein
MNQQQIHQLPKAFKGIIIFFNKPIKTSLFKQKLILG